MFGKEILENIVKKHPDSFPAVKLLENFHHFAGLFDALEGKWESGWGSYLFNGKKYEYQAETLKKQEELYRNAMSASSVLEIGVYVGHSLLIMLLANPDLKITCIDIEDKFARRAVEYLNKHFDGRITFIHGDAVKVIEELADDSFDFVHIDSDHNDSAVTSQFNACLRVAKLDSIFVFDDYEAVATSVNKFIATGYLRHIKTPFCLWTNTITKFVAKDAHSRIVEVCSRFSALSKERLLNNIDSLLYVNNNSVLGDVVEIGVYKGGSMLAFLKAQEMFSPNFLRNYHLYDTFSGMTAPSEYDKDLNGTTASYLLQSDEGTKCFSSLKEVKKNIESNTTIDKTYINYHVGDILKNEFYPDKIAILRLDTDWYESTAFELANFYEKVVSGGLVIIDDYGHWQGCKKAVDEFIKLHPYLTLKKIDYTGVFFIKP